MSVPAISKPVLWFFRRIVRGYFRRHFHAVRIAGAERFREVQGPVMVYANHSSWWDPMVSVLLAAELQPERGHYAPMDAEALEKYGILRRIGIFPVEMKTARGAVQFLRTGEAILKAGGVLWVTPQGRFCDPRERPLEFKPGMAALAARVAASSGECTLLPLAIEYPFWDERLPETLLYFAEPVRVAAGEGAEAVQARAVAALEGAMEETARRAVARRAEGFEVLAQGSLGAGGFYALGKRAKAWLTRRPYVPEHTPDRTPPDGPGMRKLREGTSK
jgi:1-acyl-sn-glycerol-3-phosphate acyltransferase